MKKFLFLIMSTVMFFCISGCTLFPKYHSEETIQEVAEEMFGENVTLVGMEKEKENKRVIYTYKDVKGREFTISSYAEHSNFDGADLPGYYNKIMDAYQKDIFMLHKDEFDEIVEENTAGTGIVLDYISCDSWGEFTDWQVASMPIYIRFVSDAAGEQIDKELRIMARMGAEMDALLAYEYDWEKTRFREDGIIYDWHTSLCGINFKLGEGSDGLRKQVMFDFSISEEERWTEEELYLYLREQLDEE